MQQLVRGLGTLSLVFILFFCTSGGPYTTETLIHSLGPGLGLTILLIVPLIWSLPEILIVSQVELLPSGALAGESTLPGLAIEAARAGGQKCARCWNWRLDVGTDPRFPTVCGRCAGVLASSEARPSA